MHHKNKCDVIVTCHTRKKPYSPPEARIPGLSWPVCGPFLMVDLRKFWGVPVPVPFSVLICVLRKASVDATMLHCAMSLSSVVNATCSSTVSDSTDCSCVCVY